EDMNRGKPNWEHLDEELHVLVSVEDYENRAAVKLRRATETIRNFLEQGVRTPENEDRLKQLQLMELAVLNDKDRQQAQAHQAQQQQQQQQQQQLLLQHQSLLSNPAAAAAAAAQLLHTSSSAQTTSQLLARLQASSIGSTNLINCTPGSAQDQYTALAAALLSGGTNNTSTNNTTAAQMSNGKVPVSAGSSKPSTSYYPMTSLASSLVDPVTIIEYNSANSVAAAQEMASDSLKLRSISSGQNRMHPYLR
ncbi:RNA-binding protein asd-2, partial [Clonorchis sinensis]